MVCDYYWQLIRKEAIGGKPNEPVAINSKFGYILSGPTAIKGHNDSSSLNFHVVKYSAEFVSDKKLEQTSLKILD